VSRTDQVTRLERHRDEFNLNRGVGPLLELEELEPDEIKLVNAEFLSRVRRVQPEDIVAIYDAYVETLHRWGIMCPHPQHQRLYDGWLRADTPIKFDESRWFSCGLCGASVINRS
jgi:hypothetical protein